MSESVRSRLCLLLFSILIFLCGCASIPQEPQTPLIRSAELAKHVEFLTQPALRGRKPKSWGSHLARRYLCRRFKALGLAPWAETRSFEQPFSLGTNVIGVLPGSDPNLAQEIVILSAHYDHLGKTSKGLCLGACDNASGVAVLLEIAEHLALKENRPRRSICFAAFDCEEMGLLGAFSFSSRDDFVPSQIAGIVNVDMLGRAGFDVLDDHLFLAGTGPHLDLRKQIQEAASGHLQVLPVGTDVIGPRGDHVPFEYMGFPTLFFSSGPYPDYHLPSDTVDKLDFELIQASADVIQATVKTLANAAHRYTPNLPDSPDFEELQGLDTVISRIIKHPDVAEVMSGNAALLEKVQTDISGHLTRPETYSPKCRKMLAYRISEIAFHYEKKAIDIKKPLSVLIERSMRSQRVFDMENRESLVYAGRKAAQHLNTYRPSLLRSMPTFSLRTNTIPDDHLAVTALDDGQYRVVYCMLKGRVRLQWSSLGKRLGRKLTDLKSRLARIFLGPSRFRTSAPLSASVTTAVSCHWTDITGTSDEIVDIVLLASEPARQHSDTVLVVEQHNEKSVVSTAQGTKSDEWTEAHGKILARVTNNKEPQTREEWMQWRFEQGAWKSEQDWIRDRLKSPHPDVMYRALLVTSLERHPIRCDILKDREKAPSLRWHAFWRMHISDSMTLQALINILDDPTAFQHQYKPLPHNHALKPLATFCRNADRRELYGEDNKPTAIGCLGDEALKRLKKLTKQDFGKDKAAWTKWIDAKRPTE
jgi:hypothetical protein